MDSNQDQKSSNKIEKLRKTFFIEEAEYDQKSLEKHLERIIEYAVITSSGKILLKKENLLGKDKVGIIILARYIASKLNEEINAILTISEIAEYAKFENKTARAYVSMLNKENIIIREDRGKYVINPVNIDKFLQSIEE